MKGSLIIVSFFILGVLAKLGGVMPDDFAADEVSMYALYALMFLVGMSVGSDTQALKDLKKMNLKVLWVPAVTIVGTLAGCAVVSLFLPHRTLWNCLAVGSGFGYYSLSSIFITEYVGAELGTVALVSNIMRELMTLLAAPLLVMAFGRLAPICAGGATTMDTTLPVIARFSGKEWVVVSMFHGFLVDFSVPFLVTFFCSL